MADIIKLDIMTKLDISAAEMLQEIATQDPDDAFVIVWPDDGSMPTYHSSTSDMPTVLYRLQSFIHGFFNGDFK